MERNSEYPSSWAPKNGLCASPGKIQSIWGENLKISPNADSLLTPTTESRRCWEWNSFSASLPYLFLYESTLTPSHSYINSRFVIYPYHCGIAPPPPLPSPYDLSWNSTQMSSLSIKFFCWKVYTDIHLIGMCSCLPQRSRACQMKMRGSLPLQQGLAVCTVVWYFIFTLWSLWKQSFQGLHEIYIDKSVKGYQLPCMFNCSVCKRILLKGLSSVYAEIHLIGMCSALLQGLSVHGTKQVGSICSQLCVVFLLPNIGGGVHKGNPFKDFGLVYIDKSVRWYIFLLFEGFRAPIFQRDGHLFLSLQGKNWQCTQKQSFLHTRVHTQFGLDYWLAGLA